MAVETLSTNKSHGGVQGVYKHASAATGTDMPFSVFVPARAEGSCLPVVWRFSGRTCTQADVTEKGKFRSACRSRSVHRLGRNGYSKPLIG